MNKTTILFLSVLLLIGSVHANPIQLKFFSEIQFADSNSTEWAIELKDDWGLLYELSLNGWYLASSSDTAYFNPGLRAEENGFLLLRSDSLQSSFTPGSSGEIITLFDSTDQWVDEIRYGAVDHSEISCPLPGQSICLFRNGEDASPFWYIDNTPTPGGENDLDGGVGTIEGYVLYSEDTPVPGVRVIYEISYHQVGGIGGPGYWDTLGVRSDSMGYYQFNRVAILNDISTSIEGFYDQDTTIQIWPDSICQVNFYLTPTVGIETNPSLQSPRQYDLKQNYPNPFNPITRIDFDLQMESKVVLKILRIDGSTLAKLVDQELAAGTYSITWNAMDTPSGIYLYSIEAGQFNKTRKMILLK